MHEGRHLQIGSVWLEDLTDAEGLRLYRFFARTLTAEYEQAEGHLFGPEAVRRIEIGMPFLAEGSLRPWDRRTLEHFRESEAVHNALKGPRRGLEETVAFLGWEDPGQDATDASEEEAEDGSDEEDEFVAEGLDYYKSREVRKRFDYLTLRRSYFARSEFERVSFRDADLSGSRIAFADWLDCDFSDADLTGAFIGAIFVGCDFSRAVLEGADLRWSDFLDCNFAGASMIGAKVVREQRDRLVLAANQLAEVEWCDDAGPEPPEG
jgi:hypothetical protein